MSGPKRADVQAELNIVADAVKCCAGYVSRAENSAINKIMNDSLLRNKSIEQEINNIKKLTNEINGINEKISKELIKTSLKLEKEISKLREEAVNASKNAKISFEDSQDAEDEANDAFERANAEYLKAKEMLENSFGNHYKEKEMDFAREAHRLFDIAKEKLKDAQAKRIITRKKAEESLKKSISALNSAKLAVEELKGNKILEAQRQLVAKRAKAEAEVNALEAVFNSVDTELINEWSDEKDILSVAHKELEVIKKLLASEKPEEAGIRAEKVKKSLDDAMRNAAENKESDERRTRTGYAIMDALRELDFDVSFEKGSASEPMRISGQTVDETGKGDFDIEMPLNGEVDFEVTAQEGDISCVAAIKELQNRLIKKGVSWNTTNWGHAEGAEISNVKIKTVEKVRGKMKSKY